MPVGARQQTPERGPRDESRTLPIDRDAFSRGSRIDGRYRLLEPARPGSAVWLASDRAQRRFALKTGPRAAIAHEHRMLAALSHPHIVRAVERIDAGSRAVLVLEYLPGGDLVSLAGGPAAHWLRHIAAVVDALDALHRRGIVHRDLKARNVMLDGDGRARLIDFGSAAASGSPWTAGGTTREAVNPGRGTGPVSPADDLYALAALLHELAHGAPPGSPGRAPADAAAGELAALAGTCLGPGGAACPDLGRFAAVIESLLQRNRS